MVLISHSGDNKEKTNNILKVAQKRFGLYGFEKTTMKEIAADINVSKASLYYYFPDKEHLFKAVVEMEQEEFFKIVDETRENTPEPIAMLKAFNVIRLKHFKTFFNLSRLRYEDFKHIKPLLSGTMETLRLTEIEIVKDIITKGCSIGIFQAPNPLEIATLYIEVLKGLRMHIIHNKELLYIEQEEYDALERKMEQFTDLFIRGLATAP
jgi:AcrR family transcriptional regulator